jgi:hypothetical protein
MRTGRILLLATALALTVGTTAEGSSHTFFHQPLTGKVTYKPSRIEFSDASLTHIRWRGWNHRIARGTGRARVNTCEPACAAGNIVHGTVTLKMYRRHTVGNRHFYRCVKGRVRAPGFSSPIQWCDVAPREP